MMWIGLLLGLVIGGLLWELPGAVTLGFLGWLAGLIIKSKNQQPGPGTGQVLGTGSGQVPASDTAARLKPEVDRSNWRLEDRVAWLERTVADLEARLAAGQLGSRAIAAEAAPGTTTEAAATDARNAAPAATLPVAPDTVPAAAVGGSIPETAAEAESLAIAAEAAPGTTEETTPPPPATPNPIVAWLTGGNAIARVGLLILFIGLAFLLKYAADQRLLPPELRLAAVAAGGIALLGIGWRLRNRNPGYALGMQGAGIAVLYLTTFGALRLYHLLPPELAFFLLAGIAVFSAILAVRQDAVALAVIGAGGGFLAPILASTGGGNHVALFGYYLILNLGILAIAWFRAWRALNLTGFVFTFVIFWAWGERSYTPMHYATTQAFLIAFFLAYVALAVLVAREKPEPGSGTGQDGVRYVPGTGQVRTRPGSDPGFGFRRYVDGTLVFGVPLAAFALQAEITYGMEYGLAISALIAAAFYLALAWGLLKAQRESWKLLAQSFVALAVVFLTVAIPLALDARWTSASWALEGAAIIWIGIRQKRTVARAFGLLLQLLAGAAFLNAQQSHGIYPLIDAPFLGAAIVALAGLWTHRLVLNNRETVSKVEGALVIPIFIWGLLWTLGAGLDEIDAHVPGDYAFAAAIAFLAAVATTFGILALRWDWRAAAWTARALLPALYLAAAFVIAQEPHPLGDARWIAWPIAFIALAWILRRIDGDNRGAYTTFLHAGTAILLALLGAVELNWLAAKYTAHGTAWSSGAAAFVPSLVVLLIALPAADDKWPITDHARAYRLYAIAAIAAWLAAWSLFANVTHDARSDPLPYMPIVNALDLAHIFAILSLAAAWIAARRSGIEIPQALRGGPGASIAAALAFIWLTAILLRTVSHWGGVPYTSDVMLKSQLAQTSLSVFWALLALAAMVFATRTARRVIWIVGAVLMGVVVAKIFAVDLVSVGTIERIVSFIAVGVALLVIGYFSPVPPRKPEAA